MSMTHRGVDVEVDRNMSTFEKIFFITGVLANGAVVTRGRELTSTATFPKKMSTA